MRESNATCNAREQCERTHFTDTGQTRLFVARQNHLTLVAADDPTDGAFQSSNDQATSGNRLFAFTCNLVTINDV